MESLSLLVARPSGYCRKRKSIRKRNEKSRGQVAISRPRPTRFVITERSRKIVDAINEGERLMRPYRIDTSSLYREIEFFRRLLKKNTFLFSNVLTTQIYLRLI